MNGEIQVSHNKELGTVFSICFKVKRTNSIEENDLKKWAMRQESITNILKSPSKRRFDNTNRLKQTIVPLKSINS